MTDRSLRGSQRTRWHVIVALSAALVTSMATPLGAQPRTVDVAALVQGYHDVGLFDGVVLAAVGDSVVLRQGYGLADVEHAILNTPTTRFRLASVTKQFTAAAVLRLAEQDRLDLHAPVARTLPSLKPEIAERITPHHLLTHSAGIVRDIEALTAKGIGDHYAMNEMIGLVNTTDLLSEPGERFAYSNAGYVLLAAVIEAVTGQPYGDAMRALLFDPLGLDDTGHESSHLVVNDRAWGYTRLVGEFVRAPHEDKTYVTGAGSLYSTADDLFAWARALQNGRVLSEESLELLFGAHTEGYAYGWGVGTYRTPGRDDQHRRAFHSGASPGFRTALALYRGHDLTVITLGNVEPTAPFLWDRVGNALLGYEEEVPRSNVAEAVYRTVLAEGVEPGLAAAASVAAQGPLGEPTESDLTRVGYAYLGADRVDQALRLFRYYVARYPDDANAHDSLGEALVAAGQIDEAIASYERAVALDPDGRIGANARRQLDRLTDEG